MKIFRLGLIVVFILALYFIGAKTRFTASADNASKGTVLKGELICLGCELQCKDSDGACDFYPHIGVLRTAGNELWYFQNTPTAQPLLHDKSLRGKKIAIWGKADAKTHHVLVNKFQVLSDK